MLMLESQPFRSCLHAQGHALLQGSKVGHVLRHLHSFLHPYPDRCFVS